MRRQTRKQRIENQNRIAIALLMGAALALWTTLATIAVGASA